jgi:hypothetical protein
MGCKRLYISLSHLNRDEAAVKVRHPYWFDPKGIQKQIPFRNDSKKSKGNSRFPSGMTARKAKATAAADSLRE